MNIQKRFYSVKDIAVYLGLKEETIRKWAHRGGIPFSKFGRAVRFDIRKIDSWVKKKECAYPKEEI